MAEDYGRTSSYLLQSALGRICLCPETCQLEENYTDQMESTLVFKCVQSETLLAHGIQEVQSALLESLRHIFSPTGRQAVN